MSRLALAACAYTILAMTSGVLAYAMIAGDPPAQARSLRQWIVPFRAFRRGEKDHAGCLLLLLVAALFALAGSAAWVGFWETFN